MIKKIKNFDVTFTSGNTTDIYLDTGVLKFDNKKVPFNSLVKLLNDKTSFDDASWHKISEDYDKSFSNDDATFENSRQKDYVILAKIQDKILSLKMLKENPSISSDSLNNYTEIFKLIKTDEIVFSDCVMKFGFFGDVSFRVSINCRNQSLALKKYFKVCSIFHQLVHDLYKNIFSELGVLYIESIIEFINAYNLNKMLIDLDISKANNINKKTAFRERALFSIVWTHFIYDDNYFEYYKESIHDLKAHTDELNDGNSTYSFKDAKVYVGWEHSFILCPNICSLKYNNKFYILPFEIAWAEWEFTMKTLQHIDFLLHDVYQIFDKKNYFFQKTKHYKRRQSELLFFIKKVINSFDDKSVTLNQRLAKMIQAQRKNWSIDDYKENIEEKNELIKTIVNNINSDKRDLSTNFLNIILFFIAVLSTFEIVTTIRGLIVDGEADILVWSFAPGLVIFFIYILYNRLTE